MLRKKTVSRAVACMAVATASAWPMMSFLNTASAATAPQYQFSQKVIQLNGSVVTKPSGFAYNHTTYMPIWYVMHTLQSLGIQSTWKNNVWNLTVPSTFQVDASNIKVGTGSIQLEINGTLMHKVNGITAVDPASGHATTFIPIWYIQQILRRIGISSPWDGTTWTLQVSYPDGHPITPPPTLPANEIATWQLMAAVDKAFSIAPDTKGPSPYDDIGSTDANWGAVHAAIDKGIYQPVSSTESGAYAPLTVTEADTMFWNAYGLTTHTAPFQPGASPVPWATAVGLNPTGVQPTDLLTPQEFAQMVSNLADIQRGYHQSGTGIYQIVYPVADEAAATFAGDSSSTTGQAFFNSTKAVQTAIDGTYQFYDGIQLINVNGQWALTMPSLFGTGLYSYTTTLGNINYELPGQSRWQMVTTLDSRELNLSAATTSIQVQIPANGLVISVGEMLPQFGGTVELGELKISIGANGPIVQRINVTQ